jgi:phospholipid/cholesterol/gamma-HCH transport system substrate-binding protein
MDKSRLEWKVGFFVLIGLVLLAVLLLQFSKGTSFFRPAYRIILHVENAGGLKPRAQVLMAGVQVGSVASMELGPQGTNVTVMLRIYSQYQIRTNAHFVLEQSGFLGDQYVAVIPASNQGGSYVDGAEAYADSPLDLQEAARKAARFLEHIDDATTNINGTLDAVRHTMLSRESLTNLSETFSNLHLISQQFVPVATNMRAFVEFNRAPLTDSISNFLAFSEQANEFADDVRELLATNSPEIAASVSNIQASTATLKTLLEGVQQGRGLAGKLLESEEIAANVSQTVSNLNITTSNLNRLGLWGILWKQKPPRTNAPASARVPLTSPKDPFN